MSTVCRIEHASLGYGSLKNKRSYAFHVTVWCDVTNLMYVRAHARVMNSTRCHLPIVGAMYSYMTDTTRHHKAAEMQALVQPRYVALIAIARIISNSYSNMYLKQNVLIEIETIMLSSWNQNRTPLSTTPLPTITHSLYRHNTRTGKLFI